MRSSLPQYIRENREALLAWGCVVLLFGAGIFFLADIWAGWVAKTPLCTPPQQTCSIAQSAGYVQTLTGSGETLTNTYLQDRTNVELGSLMELVHATPALAPYAQEMNTALTQLKAQIVGAVAADEKIYAMLQQPNVSENDLSYVTHRIRLALLTQMEQYLQSTTTAESDALQQRLTEVIPAEATSFSLSKLFEERLTSYIKAGDIFLIENLQVTGSRSDGNIFDTVTVKLTVQATQDALTRFLGDINASGQLTQGQKSMPLMRLVRLNMTTQRMTTPETSVDTPRTVYRGELELETYVKAINEQSLAPLQLEVTQLRDKARELQKTGLLRPGAESQKVIQLFELANNAERTLQTATSQKDFRGAQEELNNLKELYQSILGNYTAS